MERGCAAAIHCRIGTSLRLHPWRFPSMAKRSQAAARTARSLCGDYAKRGRSWASMEGYQAPPPWLSHHLDKSSPPATTITTQGYGMPTRRSPPRRGQRLFEAVKKSGSERTCRLCAIGCVFTRPGCSGNRELGWGGEGVGDRVWRCLQSKDTRLPLLRCRSLRTASSSPRAAGTGLRGSGVSTMARKSRSWLPQDPSGKSHSLPTGLFWGFDAELYGAVGREDA